MGRLTLKLEEYIYKFYFILFLWLLEVLFLVVGFYFNYLLIIPLILIIVGLYLILTERIEKIWILNSLIIFVILTKIVYTV
jgi:hypothetical protein